MTPSPPCEFLLIEEPVAYGPALQLMASWVKLRIADRMPDRVLILQHCPVITKGRNALDRHLLTPPARLAAAGIALCESPRGGDITYHGPGQLVAYPILKLIGEEADMRAYVARLEEAALLTARQYGVDAFRQPGKPGIWTPAGKIAAIGVRIQRWVTSHGLSFNVCPDLSAFEHIVPCGLAGERVTSLRALLGPDNAPSPPAVREILVRHLAAVFRRASETQIVPSLAALEG